MGGLGWLEVASGWRSRQAGGPVRSVAVLEGRFLLPFAGVLEVSCKEELKEKCEIKVGEYKQVRHEGQVLGSSW